MNIGFDAKRAFHNASGLGNYSRFVIRILANHYPNKSLLLFNPKMSDQWDLLTHESIQEILPPKSTWGSYWRSFRGDKKVRDYQLDAYHGLSNELPFGIAKSAAKKIVTIHDLIFKRYPELYKTTDRLIYDKKFLHACKTADTVVAVSETTKQDIVQFYKIPEQKIKVVYQGCNPIFYERGSLSELEKTRLKFNLPNKFIVCVGTIEQRKNGLQLLKALKLAECNLPLVFVGRKTTYFNEIQSLLDNDPELNKHVIFIENADNQEVSHLYQLATFSCYPSVFEGFGIPVLESIASGTPVLTNKKGCFSEAGGKAALYCDPQDLNDFSEAINRLCSDDDLVEKLQSAAKEHLKQFDEQTIASQLMEIYSS